MVNKKEMDEMSLNFGVLITTKALYNIKDKLNIHIDKIVLIGILRLFENGFNVEQISKITKIKQDDIFNILILWGVV